jgi:hypothetical protein
MVIRRLNRNSEPQASIEAGQYTLQYVYAFPLQSLSLLNLARPPALTCFCLLVPFLTHLQP